MKRSATTFLLLTALCAFIFAPAAASAQTLTKAALQQRIVIENQLRNDLFYGALNASSQTGDVAGTLALLARLEREAARLVRALDEPPGYAQVEA